GASPHDQFRLQGPGLFHGLEHRHHVARGDTQRVQRGGDLLNRRHVRQRNQRAALLVDLGIGARGDLRGARLSKWTRLRNILRGSDADGQVAVRHGATGDPNARGGNDGAGALIDDDASGNVRLDFDRFNLRDELDRRTDETGGQLDADGGGVERGGGLRESGIDGRGHARGGGEIRFTEQQVDVVVV